MIFTIDSGGPLGSLCATKGAEQDAVGNSRRAKQLTGCENLNIIGARKLLMNAYPGMVAANLVSWPVKGTCPCTRTNGS